MNATTMPSNSLKLSEHAWPVLLRCLWKEYRMLRGFWLGVAGLAVLVMLAIASLMSGSAELAVIFASAWGAAALYAVGAAVTLFAVEREEQTDAFLRLLPRNGGAVFAGKALAAALTSFTLAAVLIVIGGIVAGWRWPQGPARVDVFVIGAVTLIEFLAWGILASLVCPQPLLAAILAIAAASLGMQLAIAGTSQPGGQTLLDQYRDATAAQLMLVGAVAALDVWLGLRWLRPSTIRRTRLARNADAELGAAAVTSTNSTAPSRWKLFGRLVWQSWREGWKPMLAAPPIGLFLMFCESLLGGRLMHTSLNGSWMVLSPPVLTLLVIPALYGALAFRADQRLRQYRFLSDRAASPTLVWAARQTTWLIPLVTLGAATYLWAWTSSGREWQRGFIEALVDRWNPYRGDSSNSDLARVMGALSMEAWGRLVWQVTAVAWCGGLAAFAMGQLSSMAIRSPVLAGFAALASSAVISVWAIVVLVWQLSATWFLGVLAAGALAASLVRCGAWLREREGVRPWLAPLGILAGAILVVAWGVPEARMWQLEPGNTDDLYFASLSQSRDGAPGRAKTSSSRTPLDVTLIRWRAEEPEARDVALKYEQLAAEIDAEESEASTSPDAVADAAGELVAPSPGEAAPEEQQPGARSQGISEEQFARISEISEAPRCWFTFAEDPTQGQNRVVRTLERALASDARRLSNAGDLDAALQRFVVWRRLTAHALQYQPTFRERRGFAQGLAAWADAPGQTSERSRRAVALLAEVEAMFPQGGRAGRRPISGNSRRRRGKRAVELLSRRRQSFLAARLVATSRIFRQRAAVGAPPRAFSSGANDRLEAGLRERRP